METKKQENIREDISLSMIEHMAYRMPGGFFIYRADKEETVLYVNDVVLDIYGCATPEEFKELTGYTFRGMVHPDDYESVKTAIREQVAANDKNLDYVEYRIRRGDGRIRWVDDYGRLVHTKEDGDIYYVLLRDITEQRAAREAQFRTEMALEQEKNLSALKSAFLFNVSHDIRTPMNAIMGFTSLAKRHREDPERLREYLDKVEESSHYLLALIDDLLEMGEIDCGHVEIKAESCSLEDQIRITLDMFRPQIEEKRLTLETDIQLPQTEVILDALRFRRVMGNLLSNAVKFTHQGSVRISARQKTVSNSGYARYEISVSDTGIGMTEEFMQRMYEAFERKETSTKTGYFGTGLGLTITKRLLDLMGGSISAVSKKGKGTSFQIELPLKMAAHRPTIPAHSTEAQEMQASRKRRILQVEDIDVNRMLVEAVLTEAGFLVESVPDGCDAVEIIRNHPPGYYDLVLMDIQMPVMNGYEATRTIRAMNREDTADLPIIALSANAREQDRRMSMECGMNAHVAKPFEIPQLIAAVNRYIEDRKGRI